MPAKRSGGRVCALSPSIAVRVFWMICRSCNSGWRSARSATSNHAPPPALTATSVRIAAAALRERAREFGKIVVGFVLTGQVWKIIDGDVELALRRRQGVEDQDRSWSPAPAWRPHPWDPWPFRPVGLSMHPPTDSTRSDRHASLATRSTNLTPTPIRRTAIPTCYQRCMTAIRASADIPCTQINALKSARRRTERVRYKIASKIGVGRAAAAGIGSIISRAPRAARSVRPNAAQGIGQWWSDWVPGFPN